MFKLGRAIDDGVPVIKPLASIGVEAMPGKNWLEV